MNEAISKSFIYKIVNVSYWGKIEIRTVLLNLNKKSVQGDLDVNRDTKYTSFRFVFLSVDVQTSSNNVGFIIFL